MIKIYGYKKPKTKAQKAMNVPSEVRRELKIKSELSQKYFNLLNQYQRDKLSIPGIDPNKVLLDAEKAFQTQLNKII
jgi:hypothetical protein